MGQALLDVVKAFENAREPRERGDKVAPPWSTLVLVCSNCRGAKRGPNGDDIRKHLKKSLGKPKSLRVLEVDCLKDCPDDAVATTTIEAHGAPVRIVRVASQHDLAALTAELAQKHD